MLGRGCNSVGGLVCAQCFIFWWGWVGRRGSLHFFVSLAPLPARRAPTAPAAPAPPFPHMAAASPAPPVDAPPPYDDRQRFLLVREWRGSRGGGRCQQKGAANACAPAPRPRPNLDLPPSFFFSLSFFPQDLEFVQALACPHYVLHLSQAGYLADPAFLAYLRHLEYWREPPYAAFLQYPAGLAVLDLLHSASARAALGRPDVADWVHAQQFFQWSRYWANRAAEAE